VEIVDSHKEEAVTTDTVMPPVRPREIVLEELPTPLRVSQYQLAKAIWRPDWW
jgi:plasmid maintenance system antidote protein VapI